MTKVSPSVNNKLINLNTFLKEYIIVFEMQAKTPNWTHIVNRTFVANELRPRLSLNLK